ncbi:acyltransferase family protein [Streptomyces sp. TRM 70351]|uniref:acyltransferase family protein n=1 Tax=Streptomyces sp. TRM 70351 TaxID=3116552 RepID=UPI002E7B54DC|nr:acyltransferase family protein [Streptomyces sp. TRM 70351]MEE1928379.1 acyltransferase family protein [Streptomyces sp. TRM 70351]
MFSAGTDRASAPPGPLQPSDPAPDAAPSPPAGEAAAPRGREKHRDPFFDNAKYLAIVLVGLGHAIGPLSQGSRPVEAVYFFIYAFHMPAFVIMSGYFSRSFEARPAQIRRLVTGVAVPYLVFEVIYNLFMGWLNGDLSRPFTLLIPGYALWFLAALFIWRITTPVWKALRWPLPVALVIAASAVVAEGIGPNFNLMRVLQFLPFFVLGLQLRPEHFELVRHRAVRVAALVVAPACLVAAYLAVPRVELGWFYRDNSAADLGAPAWYGVVMSLATFGCALVLTVCLYAWVPRRRTWFTALGAGTIAAYLLHVYPVLLARDLEVYSLSWMATPLGPVVVTVVTVAGMSALCSPPVRRLFRPLMEPRLTWAFRREPAGRRD